MRILIVGGVAGGASCAARARRLSEEAEIIIGENVPFVTGSFTSTGAADGATNPFQTIQREDVGLTLKIKPQINEGDAMRLEIEQEVSSLAESVGEPRIS